MTTEHPHLGGFALLPAKKGTCSECSTAHPPEQPHNQQSLYYQYNFYGKHGRWPQWKDAMAHCSREMQEAWAKALAEHGVSVELDVEAKQ